MSLLKPTQEKRTMITEDDLERAERNKFPLCDEANLQVFKFWYEMGGLRRPLTPVEAAETPGILAKDFIYLIRRMRELADTELHFNDFANSRHLYKDQPQLDDIYNHPSNLWE